MVEEGNLVFEGGDSKNITFRTRGGGVLNLVGLESDADLPDTSGSNSVLDLLGGGRERQRQIDERLTRLETSVNAGEGLDSRLRSVEEQIQQLMVSGGKNPLIIMQRLNAREMLFISVTTRVRRPGGKLSNGHTTQKNGKQLFTCSVVFCCLCMCRVLKGV